MARYAVSAEGVAALRALAKRLFTGANSVLEASARLQNTVSSLCKSLGVYEKEISDIIAQGKSALSENHDNIEKLAKLICEKADDIESLISGGLGDTSNATASYTASDAGISGSGMAAVPNLAPTRKTPRDLPETQLGFEKDSDGNLVYDSPIEMNEYLYKEQGSAYPDYQGTCGLCSCANILRLAGVNLSEKDMIDYASAADGLPSLSGKLCLTGYDSPGINGGTSPAAIQQILEHFGISSGLVNLSFDRDGSVSNSTIKLIADQVSTGHGVILSAHADILWHDKEAGKNDGHAITVTSVKKNENGDVLGFYVCDSARGGTKYYSADKLRKSLTGAPMNITYSKIR